MVRAEMLHDGTIVCFKSNKDNPIKYNNSKKVVTKCWKYTRILTNGTKYEYIGNPIKINPKTNKVTQYESFIQTDPNRPNVTPLEEGEKREKEDDGAGTGIKIPVVNSKTKATNTTRQDKSTGIELLIPQKNQTAKADRTKRQEETGETL